ncbi:MAG TPA: glycosyltransferase family 39 protein [Labilithrix sp.]|nr:glycosyltransferase family 39 protein [Labilithrix sp.]
MSDRAERAWQRAVLTACVVALVAVHAPLIGYGAYANVDEAYASALAERLNEGFKLYEGAVSQRGPLMYYFFAALSRAFGWDNVVAVRVAALVLMLLHVGLVAWVARRLVSPRAGVVAAVVSTYALVAGLPPLDGMALHGEAIQVPLLVGAAAAGVLATRAEASKRRRWLVGSGLLFGAAVAVKQSAILQPLPTVLWLCLEARRQAARRFPARQLLIFAGACAAVPAAFLVHAAASGTLSSLLYYTLTYNLGVHLRPSEALLSSASLIPLSDHVMRLTAFVAATLGIAGALGAFFLRRARAARRARSAAVLARGFDVRVYFALHLVVAVVAASAMYRFFPHYYVSAVPFLALALAAWTRRPLARLGAHRLLGGIAAATLLVAAAFTTYMNEKIDGRLTHDVLPQRVGRYLDATTAKDARIFVWGFSPWLYGYSHRRPAGRYVFETYVTGFVPWFHDSLPREPGRVVPGSMNALLGDLEREAPEVVVDTGSIVLGRPMRAYAPAARWLAASFCFEVRVGAYDIYRRKAAGATCPSASSPLPHPPVDFAGVPMVVPMPELAPGETGTRLCKTFYDGAVWFPDQPPPARLDLLADSVHPNEPVLRCAPAPPP